MQMRYFGSLRKVFGALLAGTVLVALSGCYPYYWDHGGYGYGHYERGYHGQQHHRDRDDYHRRDRDGQHRYRRY